MSDSEDDYMSDKLLQGCEKEDVRPGLIYSKSQKRQHELHKRQHENQPKSYKQQEHETREKGLNTALSSENKGFQLLQKMGYKEGSTLGKSETALTQPIPIQLKLGTSGVGHKTSSERLQIKKRKIDLQHKESEKKFRASNIEKGELLTLKKDLYKAQKACEDLDFRNDIKYPAEEFFWTKQTLQELVRKKEDEEGSEEDEDKTQEEADNKVIIEEKLSKLLEYLREKYYYCVYCVARATDEEDLKSFCPGLSRADHDAEDLL